MRAIQPINLAHLWWRRANSGFIHGKRSRTAAWIISNINGREIPLRRNAAFDLFQKRITARAIGSTCGDCALYRVTATLTGMFWAAPGGDRRPGYGHLGCCHLLAIEEVADVYAERTKVRADSYPLTTNVVCENLFSTFPVSHDTLKPINEQVASGAESWRLGSVQNAAGFAIQEAAQRWHIQLAPGLQLQECSKLITLNGDQFSWCNWVDTHSMQALSIQLTRFGVVRRRLRGGHAPWILSRGDGIACTAED